MVPHSCRLALRLSHLRWSRRFAFGSDCDPRALGRRAALRINRRRSRTRSCDFPVYLNYLEDALNVLWCEALQAVGQRFNATKLPSAARPPTAL